jgi:long-chain acyl-CoA synthetase
MVAGYGLAEATVGVSMGKPGTPVKVDAHGRVSAGRPFPGVELRILSNGQTLPPGEAGEIAIRSPANTPGYFDNPAASARLFWGDGYLLSGDLGYLDQDGCLYISGRLKNIIKRSGETISPQEIEELVDALPRVRFSAALGIDRGGPEGEQVYVFAEIRDGESLSRDELHELATQIVAAFHVHMGFRPARVYLLKPRSIPLTHNGKIRHTGLKEMYLEGSLREGILFPDY